MLVSRSSPFGGQTRTLVLLALSLLEESFPRELARLLEVSLNGVQQALRGLERDGLVAARLAGGTRPYRPHPAYCAREGFPASLQGPPEAGRVLLGTARSVGPPSSSSFPPGLLASEQTLTFDRSSTGLEESA